MVSGGRTGTKYFGEMLAQMIPDSFSVHEPDVIAGFEYPVWQRIRDFGLYHAVIGKLTGRTGIRNLSQRFLSGKISISELKDEILQHRRKYYARIDHDLIIESYTAWYGVIPAIPLAFPSYKIVGVIRDPRTWVTSIMNWGTMYGPRDWVGRLSLGRLTPHAIHDERWAEYWPEMNRFEKVCWAWQAINSIMLDSMRELPHVLTLRYEDLFLSPSRKNTLYELLDFLTDFGDRKFPYHANPALLDRRIHQSRKKSFPEWPQWAPEMAVILDRHCGRLMSRFDYGQESEWRKLCSRSGE